MIQYKAIGSGLLIIIFLWLFVALLSGLGVGLLGSEYLPTFNFVVSFIGFATAGYVTAKVAKIKPILKSAIVGSLVPVISLFVVGFLYFSYEEFGSLLHYWKELLMTWATLPLVLFGAAIYVFRVNASTAD